MNGTVGLRMKNPEVLEYPGAAGTWTLSALEARDLAAAIGREERIGTSPPDIIRRVGSGIEEGTLVFRPFPGFADPRVLAFKSIIGSRDLYWVSTDEGRFILSDRFAELIPELRPHAARLTDGRAVHFLLGCNLRGDWTLVEDIRRVGHGEMVLFTPGEKEPERRRIGRFSWTPAIEDEGEALDVLERALEKVSSLILRRKNSALMFSGGADSTLLWAFLRIPALTGFIDTEPAERDVAVAVAERHGIPHGLLKLEESKFLDDFRKALADAGMPFIISNYQMLYYSKAFGREFSHLVSGELADSMWGISHITRIFDGSGGGEYARAIAESPLSPRGYGIRVNLMLPDDLALLSGIFGDETILGLLGHNLDYVLECLDPAVPLDRDFRAGHADLGSLAFILNGCWRSNYRQAGYVHGVGFSFPFESLSMVRAALSLALPRRILSKEGVRKPLIRRMLAKRLPDAVLADKSGSGLPRTRYCREGPFRGFFRDRPIPAFWPAERADLLVNPTWESSSLVMKCISLELWADMFLRKRGLGNKP
jgi:asparagine synthetase B (glutamine-hydrolysing)